MHLEVTAGRLSNFAIRESELRNIPPVRDALLLWEKPDKCRVEFAAMENALGAFTTLPEIHDCFAYRGLRMSIQSFIECSANGLRAGGRFVRDSKPIQNICRKPFVAVGYAFKPAIEIQETTIPVLSVLVQVNLKGLAQSGVSFETDRWNNSFLDVFGTIPADCFTPYLFNSKTLQFEKSES